MFERFFFVIKALIRSACFSLEKYSAGYTPVIPNGGRSKEYTSNHFAARSDS